MSSSPGEIHGQPVRPDYEAVVESNSEARMFAMLCHLAGLLGYFVPILGNILGPLIFWVLKKDRHPFVDDQGKEAINFQITVSLGLLISVPLMFLLIGFLTAFVIVVAALVLLIIAAVQANQGRRYRYPMTIRFIR
jgi:uncharacterized protein